MHESDRPEARLQHRHTCRRFMLQLDMQIQAAGVDEQIDVFMWMIRTVTRSMFELNCLGALCASHPQGQAAAVVSVGQAVGDHPPSEPAENASPNAAVLSRPSSSRYWAMRVESVVDDVIKQLTGLT
ncbi:MAG: hypothetical protein SGPRY_012456 [Prymnesium sp.]